MPVPCHPSHLFEGGQPDEWEELLADVTVGPESRQVLYTPKIMEFVMAQFGERYARYLADSSSESGERAEQLRRIKELARRKLSGRQRDCFLLYALAGKEPQEIALELGIAPASARRNIDRATEKIASALDFTAGSQFTASRDQVLRTVVLPIDSEEERNAFQEFVNNHLVHHVAYSGLADAREVLVVWSAMPEIDDAKRVPAEFRTALLDILDSVATDHIAKRSIH